MKDKDISANQNGEQTKALRELVIAGAAAVFVLVLSSIFDVPEALLKWSQSHPNWKISEFALAPLIFALAFGIYAMRRWMGLKREIAGHWEAAAALQEAQKDFEKQVEERAEQRAKVIKEASARSEAEVDLELRIKQLDCFYGLSRLTERPKISLEEILQETVHLIRKAYQHPDFTCVRITYEGIKYETKDFSKTELSQYGELKVGREKVGTIEVYYIGELFEGADEPFLKEERDLLDAVAERLGRLIELKLVVERLRLFRNLIDRSNDCIFVMDAKRGRLRDPNDRACAVLGYTRKELLDMSFSDIEEFENGGISWEGRLRELRSNGDIVKEGQLRRKDGTKFFAETSLKLVSEGKEDYIIAISRDVTERKWAEEKQARLLEEVESANQELKDFAHIVSHDLKAPLRGIKTIATWILGDYSDKFDEKGKEQMNLLSGRVDRMHNLIDGVLQYSRVGRIKEEKVKVDIKKLIPDVIDMVAPPKNISVTVEDVMPVIECEETRIMQVFQNLLSNAIKYMDKEQGQINVGCTEEDGLWRFSVCDNGPGIEEKHFEKIFQMFQTLSSRDEYESTGVGLTVVKKIVELYGGSIWVESKVGEGSTFFFTFPKQESEVIDNATVQANTTC